MTMRTTATALILAAGMATAAASSVEADEFDHDFRQVGDGVPLSVILMRLEALGYRHISDVGYVGGTYGVRGRMIDGSGFTLSIDARTGEIDL
ncbi:hypothetical protein [Govanella unica]|uniref:PepSY domain-containing protein n=1 Tax=Govanella unica TaxID=2975056 RepID=A0A9X3Z647_9PROT|nr:hypothetical protein [Govania unica]MDA5192633.1 hypothetical protein [Govania unica]